MGAGPRDAADTPREAGSSAADGPDPRRDDTHRPARRRGPSEWRTLLSPGGAGPVLALKDGESFLFTAADGDVDLDDGRGLGFYHRDTRFLSRMTMRLGGRRPVLLSSSTERGYLAQIHLTNPDLVRGDDEIDVPHQTLNVRRTRVIGRRLHERLRIRNYGQDPVAVVLEIAFACDFADVFEVRGLRRAKRAAILPPRQTDRGVTFSCLGIDDLFRTCEVTFADVPGAVVLRGDTATFTFPLALRPHQTQILELAVEPRVGEDPVVHEDFDATIHLLRTSYERWEGEATRIRTSNETFDRVLQRGLLDVRALLTSARLGSYVAAGIPWYAAPFGRHALLAAYELLAVRPDVAAGTLRAIAAQQGREVDDWRDEQPGKVLHELRQGELALSGEVPYTPYYGSVDATPLFCMLAAAYVRWTNDMALVAEIADHLRAAIAWIDVYGDVDGDGFVEYERRSTRGLENHGWKDSPDAICHPDGTPAIGPIALAEVQAYVYMAKARCAELFDLLGDAALAERLRGDAEALGRRFDDAFWMPDVGYYAMALDGAKRQVATIASNPAHGLYCGIVPPSRASHVADRVMQPDMFSGWGIRTMSSAAAAYNPMSYHRGSVWPHDNAVAAAGLKRYGFHDATNRIAGALVDAAAADREHRLPELFCGFARRSARRPVAYPVACVPHGPAAASVFLLVQAMLGISARAHENLLTVNAPVLPPWLDWVRIEGLRVGASWISLLFSRQDDVTSFTLQSKDGDVRVVMEE